MVFANLVPETTTASKLIHERWKFLLNERIVGLNLSIAGGIESEKEKEKNSCSFKEEHHKIFRRVYAVSV